MGKDDLQTLVITIDARMIRDNHDYDTLEKHCEMVFRPVLKNAEMFDFESYTEGLGEILMDDHLSTIGIAQFNYELKLTRKIKEIENVVHLVSLIEVSTYVEKVRFSFSLR